MSEAGKTEPLQDPIASLSVPARTPPFWKERPSLWFTQLEALLAPQKLSDESKYNFVVANLDRQALTQISDLLLAPPETNKYQTLKTRLIEAFEETEERRLQQLLEGLELGDQTPSQLLRRIKEMAGTSGAPTSIIQVLWMNKLPAHVRAIISTCTGDLENQAKIADKVTAHCQPSLSLSAIKPAPTQPAAPDIMAILGQIQQELAALKVERRDRGRSFNKFQRSRSRSQHRDRSTDRGKCFYHRRFGAQAKKCQHPCSFLSGNAQQHQA